MNIIKATRKYEAWLGEHLHIIRADLELKHRRMADDLFSFFRATFYRWIELWPEVCPGAARAPRVLAVGDLHVENLGTWRDIEGRLVWGINDFDEAYPLPYTIDLVRLAASAHLAISAGHLALTHKDACDAILTGYTKSLESGGQPFVLEEAHDWLLRIAVSELRNPVQFWDKMDHLPPLHRKPPKAAVRGLKRLLPEPRLEYSLRHRVAGLGSLGRERYVALADWRGGRVAREAKALAPSACVWARGDKGWKQIFYERILERAVRCRDPFVELRGRWIVRRLGPHCTRVELVALPKERDELKLLDAMGWETANVHLARPEAVKDIQRDLAKRPAPWLHNAAAKMVKAVTRDWEEWKQAMA